MGRSVCHFALAANLVAVCGCGAVATSVDPHPGAGDAVTDASSDDQAQATPIDPASIRTPVEETALSGTSPVGVGVGAIDESILVSLFLDRLLLDLINPTGPLESFTFLERLCLEGDDPDFVCRQLYGR